MKADSRRFLFNLLNTPSPSGYEEAASALFRKRVKGKTDELRPDVHGNTIAILNPKAKFTFMLAGHIDEIGLMVTHIDDKGFLYVSQIGGMDPALLVGQRVKIMSGKETVTGVIGRKAIHLMESAERQKPVKMENVWVDIGASDKKDAEKAVSVGDAMVIDVECMELRGDKLIGRAMDNKVGAYLVAEILRELWGKKLSICVVGVATVQEEVGFRGAITSSYSVHPDAGIAFDVNFASDHPETDAKKIGDVKLGGGANLHRGCNINPKLGAELVKTAKRHKIPYQVSAQARATGTDANAMQLSRGGVATALVSIPNRYMHTPVEVVSTKDLDAIVKLVSRFLLEHPAKRDYKP